MKPDPQGPNVLQSVPFLSVADIEASVRFYGGGLGFEMTNQWVDEGKLRWCWLQHGGAALMLQEFRREGHDSWAPSVKVGEGVSIAFICRDALAIYHQAKQRGLSPSQPRVGNGMWVTRLADPDGYQIFFESATDVAEGTDLSEQA